MVLRPQLWRKKIDESNNLHENSVDESKKMHKMTLPPPTIFNPELSSDRLESVSQWLLDELYATEDDLSRPTDNGYTRGCTTFGRQRNRIIAEALRAIGDVTVPALSLKITSLYTITLLVLSC